MVRLHLMLILGLLGMNLAPANAEVAKPLQVLILSGIPETHHDYKNQCPNMFKLLRQQGHEVTLRDRAIIEEGDAKRFDVVVLMSEKWRGDQQNRQELLQMVRAGKGLAVIHMGYVPCAEALGGKASRNGKTGAFKVEIVDRKHPITAGVEDFSAGPGDELYAGVKFQADDVHVLARGQDTLGTWEPIAWVRNFGKGKVFYISLGHSTPSQQNPGFVKLVTQAVCWAGGAETAQAGAVQAADPQPAAAPAKAGAACDFQASFMTWDLPPPKKPTKHNIPLGNKARIQIDAFIDVINEETGSSERFVLIAPCRTEWVYVEKDLFQMPSGEYRVIFSLKDQRSMRRALTYGGEVPRGQPLKDTFRSLTIDMVTFPQTRLWSTPAEICAATGRNLPLIGRTELRDAKRKERYILEYPIKTMNFRPEGPSFQVDTGPLLVPDVKSSATATIDRLEMAHIAYNRLDRAEFILRRPTTIANKEGQELVRVLHYSEVHDHAVQTQILSGERR